ncbi:MAG: pilus assembly protein TadD [Caulobacteraceae bacterium]|nr:pilus assembly protein TadD [Caulobacteraceae bacterium]
MCRKLALVATALVAAGFAPEARAADAKPAAQPAAAPAAASPSGVQPTPTPRKATAEERAAADRLPPLTRAAFWAREADIDPADSAAGTHLAMALRALGQYGPAATAAERVLVIDPKNYDALLEDARDHIAEGRGFYAIDPAQRAQALAPKDWRPLSLLGVAYVQVRRDDDAQIAWRTALTLSPENPSVLANMAMAAASQGDAAGAEALLRRAASQPGAGLQVRQDLSLVLGLEGKLAEAEKLLREDLPPDQADADLAYLKAVSSGHDAGQPAAAPAASASETRTWNSVRAAGG